MAISSLLVLNTVPMINRLAYGQTMLVQELPITAPLATPGIDKSIARTIMWVFLF
jgi:hypothetical protein